MYKINTDIAKKSIKQMMVISAMATLMLAVMGSIPATKSYALHGMDFMKMVPGMGSDRSDRSDGSDKGSIGADSLLGCFGVATDCINKDNNNRHTHIDNTLATATATNSTTGNTTHFDNAACAVCFTTFLNPTQLGDLKFALGVPVAGSNSQLCDVVQGLTGTSLHAAIVLPVVGVTDAVATNIINCLIKAGFTNLST